jgi:hypothetical protein
MNAPTFSRWSSSAALGLAVALTACDDPHSGPSDRAAAFEATPAGEIAPPDSEKESTPATMGDWRTRVEADIVALEEQNPQLHAMARALEPRPTRAGFLRFSTTAIHDPAVAAVFIDRLAHGHEPPEVRAALAEALPRTAGTYGDAVIALLDAEREASVRLALIAALHRVPGETALSGLRIGLNDRDPAVRAEAARVVGARPDGHALAAEVEIALRDDDASTRAAAARALGILGIDSAYEALARSLDDGATEVRLEALRAVVRLDPVQARLLDTVDDLRKDDDVRIRRMADTAKLQ